MIRGIYVRLSFDSSTFFYDIINLRHCAKSHIKILKALNFTALTKARNFRRNLTFIDVSDAHGPCVTTRRSKEKPIEFLK
jgi:hypothetical protein